jgi:signal peptidase I
VTGIGSLFGLQAVAETEYVKPVIAAGGQTVDEPYSYVLLEAGATQQQASSGPVRVPEGHLWVVGDSRSDSVDPRAEGSGGPVPVANVIGKGLVHRLSVRPARRDPGAA